MTNKKQKTSLTVVGIGASAGGLEPLQAAISHLPSSLPSIAIITAQHLSPDYKSMLVDLLGRKTAIPVKDIENGMQVEGNTIYIAPPNADVIIKENSFHLKKPVEVGAHPSIDVLFTSLAKEYGKNSCGIILSGTGKDGTRGIIAIKKAGGVTVAQVPETAKYEGMPKSAANTGVVDHILSAEEIGEKFSNLLAERHISSDQIHDFGADTNEAFPQILDLLERRIGIDFSDYKISTLSRRLQKRILEKKFDNEEEYLDYIRQNPEELDKLFEEILIGVTSFFRDPAAFKAVEKILEKIITEKKSGETFRIWIPGCATGEEAYTYAIIIEEILEKTKKHPPIQIFATDIDIKALQKARMGLYNAATLSTVPKHLLPKYFIKINDTTYEVHKDVRKMVLFSRHDVTSNPPFLRLDLISCRNLLIYFNTELQKRVLPLFYYALNPNGYMILGKSENIGQFNNLFATDDASVKIFQRKSLDGKVMKFPHFSPTKTRKIITEPKTSIGEDLTISEMVKETLYNSFEHPYVVIDESMDIVEVHGDVSSFLKFKEGSVTLNLMKLVIPQLQIETRAVTGKAMTNMKHEQGNIRKITISDKSLYVRLFVKPLLYAKTNNPYFIVIFEEIKLDERFFKMGKEVIEQGESPRVIELEQELDATNEHMNSLVEELETSNEELQALNEEMQASNEELQASNEELETSNEELQATNEELENAYSELREANKQIAKQKDEIEQSAQNLDTLLNNTLVAFILIDRDYKVITCNNTAGQIYKSLFQTNLEPGVSFIKILPDSIFPAFHKNFKKALEGKQIVTVEEIQSSSNGIRYFDFNYTPVKLEGEEKEARMIAVSFVDVTERKKAALELQEVNQALLQEKQFMQTLSESLPNIVWTTDTKGVYIYCNQQFMRYVGKTFDEIRELTWKPFIHPDDWKKTKEQWDMSLETGDILSVEHRIKNSKSEYRWHLTQARAIKNPNGSIHMWVGTSTNIEEQKQLDQKKDEFISIASHELKTPVTSLKAYTQVMQTLAKKEKDRKSIEFLTKIDSQLNRLTDLINDLLDISKIQSGKLQLKLEYFSFDEVVDEVIEYMQLLTNKHKITRKGKTNRKIYADKDRINQVITNLLSNAIKYSPQSDKIIVKTAAKNGKVDFSVQDFGIGIPSDKQGNIFGRFFRANGADTSTFPGLGLGLYISAEIIKRLNGEIGFESKEGKGSTFYFSLPSKK